MATMLLFLTPRLVPPTVSRQKFSLFVISNRNVTTAHPSLPQEGLSGLVERVTFYNEETGFAVLRVNVKGYRELVTVLGALASVNAGEWITAQGNWVQDKEHGCQFKATFLNASPPTSKEASNGTWPADSL